MSTATAEQPLVGFGTPAITEKPRQICAGKVVSVRETRESKSGQYYVIDIKLEALDAGDDHIIYLCFRPEWFRAHTHEDFRRMKEDTPGVYRMFEQHISANLEDSKAKPSYLQGLTVTAEKFKLLENRLVSLGETAINDNPALVSQELEKFLIEENGDTIIGYVRKQQTEKTGDVNPETGKPIYVPTKFHEIDSFWVVNPTNIKKMTEKAEKTAGKRTGVRFKMCYAGCAF